MARGGGEGYEKGAEAEPWLSNTMWMNLIVRPGETRWMCYYDFAELLIFALCVCTAVWCFPAAAFRTRDAAPSAPAVREDAWQAVRAGGASVE